MDNTPLNTEQPNETGPAPTVQPAPSTPQPGRAASKWWLIAAGVALVIVAADVTTLLTRPHKSADTAAASTVKLGDVILPANAPVDPAHLPSGSKLFYTMLDRTATKPVISGYYAEGQYSGSADQGSTLRSYQVRSDLWTNGAVTSSYADVPYDASQTIYSLLRCDKGVFSSFHSYTSPAAWKQGTSADSQESCNQNRLTRDGYSNIDGVLTGGLSSRQAALWTLFLSEEKDPTTNAKLFTFQPAKAMTVQGRQVIVLDFTVNDIQDPHYCKQACGSLLLKAGLVSAGIDINRHGYQANNMYNILKGTYIIDPQTVLPLTAAITSYKGPQQIEDYRRAFRFEPVDFSQVSTARPASADGFLKGFTFEQNDLPPPPTN